MTKPIEAFSHLLTHEPLDIWISISCQAMIVIFDSLVPTAYVWFCMSLCSRAETHQMP